MRKETFLVCSLAFATLVSCSSDEAMSPEVGNGKVEFCATINGQPLSRAYDRTWEVDDHIGISCVSGEKNYANVDYKHSGGGNFAVATPGEEIYYQTADEVTFTAYYPWNDLQEATTNTADTWIQSKQKQFDFLHATATGKKAQPNVAFAFNHKMTKLVLTVKKGADVSFEEVNAAKLMLDGFKHEGVFDIATGEAKATGYESTMWEFAGNSEEKYNAPKTENADESVTYTLILFPQTFTDKLPFTATLTGKQSFTADLDFTAANSDTGKNEWVAGRQYNMSVTLHKTAITVEGCTIVGWEEKPGGNFDAN